MRFVVQRVLESAVSIDGKEVSRIGQGMMVLIGITQGDTPDIAKKYVNKILKLRIWPEIVKAKAINGVKETNQEEEKKSDSSPEVPKENGRALKTWDSNVVDNNFDIMVVSQFTLYGIMKGNKPDFHNALNPQEAVKIYDGFVEQLRKSYKADKVQTGGFGEYMHVHLVNDGPVTLIIDSDSKE